MFGDEQIIKNQSQTVNSKDCLLGKNLPEKLHKEMEDIKSDNILQ